MYEPQAKFGRLRAPDINDRRFMISPPATAVNVVSKYHYTDLVIDQGETSACVGAASRGWLSAGPVRNMSGPSWWDIYTAGQAVDEWPGAEPAYYGTSVRAAFKVLKAQGFVKSYNWAFDLDTAINHILTVSPMCLGTIWTTDMMRPDKEGFIHVGGRAVGGHAYLAIGANRSAKCPDGSLGAVRIVNSWGKGWGQNGRAWISFKDLDTLIKDDGEACAAVEAKAPVARSVEPPVMTAQTYD